MQQSLTLGDEKETLLPNNDSNIRNLYLFVIALVEVFPTDPKGKKIAGPPLITKKQSAQPLTEDDIKERKTCVGNRAKFKEIKGMVRAIPTLKKNSDLQKIFIYL